MFLYKVKTTGEIEQEFGLPKNSVVRDIHRGRFRPSEIRKSGGTWLITAREARRVYTGKLTFIPVKDDWYWVVEHVKEELENPALDDLVRKVLGKPFLDENDVKNLASLYHDGMRAGLNGNIARMSYLPFSQWFYEFFEDRIEEILEAERGNRND